MERVFKRQLTELENIFQFIGESLSGQNDSRIVFSTNFVVEEIFTNMVKYNRTSHEDVTIGIEEKEGSLHISFIDRGVDRFDPRESADVDTSLSAGERSVGGLGIYLVKKMAEQINYEYADRTSKITVTLAMEKKNV